jgi:gamma-glutamyltranspeptidase/glutathione hydrolase
MGGDNFWLISDKNKNVCAIDSCGPAANNANIDFYKKQGFDSIPSRGPLSALTVPGAVAGWKLAYDFSVKNLGGKIPISRLLFDAEQVAKEGIAVTNTLRNNLKSKLYQLEDIAGFKDVYFKNGKIPNVGDRLTFPKLSNTFSCLIKNGLEDFYSGDVFSKIVSDLDILGSPLNSDDFKNYQASFVDPLELKIKDAKLFNLPPPTQGLASMLILGLLDELSITCKNDVELIHKIVEVTKVVFKIRDKHISDPRYMSIHVNKFLTKDFIKNLAKEINFKKAAPWPSSSPGGDTVWLGATDSYGNTVSFIQSIYWEFGSGLVLPNTGITMQNRGVSFSLDLKNHNHLLPGRKPFHTIQPALAHFDDGRVMSYGTMGGEGQPQTQATIFYRYNVQNLNLQNAVNEPRWLLGKTWGEETTSLKIEERFSADTFDKLKSMGHFVEKVGAYEEIMGHAGALVSYPNGLKEGGYDLRSDGLAIGG